MNAECIICICSIKEGDQPVATQCGHIFHNKCLSDWVKSSSRTCPQCRKYVPSTKIIRLYPSTEDKAVENTTPGKVEDKQTIKELEAELIKLKRALNDYKRRSLITKHRLTENLKEELAKYNTLQKNNFDLELKYVRSQKELKFWKDEYIGLQDIMKRSNPDFGNAADLSNVILD